MNKVEYAVVRENLNLSFISLKNIDFSGIYEH